MQPQPTTRIPLRTRNGSIVGHTIVDAADADWVNQWTWRILRSGHNGKTYARRVERIGSIPVTILLHRELLGLPRRRRQPEVDHINGDGCDNRRLNMRVVTRLQQMQNRQGATSVSASGYRGVIWSKGMNKWAAQVRLNGKLEYLDYFLTAELANEAVIAWRREHMPYSVERD